MNMRRPLSILCALAVGASVLALSAPAVAQAASGAASSAAADAVPDELLVGYVPGATATDKRRARERAAAQHQEQVVAAAVGRTSVELVRLPSGADRGAAIRRLESDPAVAYAEPNWVYQHAAVDDPYWTDGRLWGLKSATASVDITDTSAAANRFGSGAAAAWEIGLTGSGETYIGVIDEGIQWTHPDLAERVGNPNEAGEKSRDGVDNDENGYVDDAYGWDFAGNDKTVYDGGTKGNSDDHGTHVAGTIGARANGIGVVGVNHDVRMISGKFLGSRGGTLANAVKAVDYFTDLKVNRNVNIVATNNSWGGGGYSTSLLDAITRGARAGILFIAAAGNSGTDNDSTPSYPSGYDTTSGGGSEAAAAYDAVIAVAAIDSSGALAGFSQYGRNTVDLGAPGVGIWSTTAPGLYESYNGTSMATPHVAGAVALYAAARGGTAATIKQSLLDTAPLTSSLCGKTSTEGRLDIAAALAGTARTGHCGTTTTGDGTSAGKVDVTKGTKSGAWTAVTATWSGFKGAQVLVRRTGAEFRESNPGSKTESWRGTGVVTYTVCELDGTGCVSDSETI